MSKRILMLLVLCALLPTACTRSEISNVERNPEGGVDATVTLTESDLNADLQEAFSASANPLLRNPQVDLQPGKLVINGEHDQRDGSGTVSGSITVMVSVVDSKLQATVSEVNLEGLDLSDERIASFNERLSAAFARRAARDRGVVDVKSVNITDSTFEMVVNVKRQ